MPQTERIVIKCTEETKERWEKIKEELKMSGEKTLNYLMDLYERSKFPLT